MPVAVQWYYLSAPLPRMRTHTPAQHVGEAHKAHISQFKGATVTGLQELLTEVQADTLHLQPRDNHGARSAARFHAGLGYLWVFAPCSSNKIKMRRKCTLM